MEAMLRGISGPAQNIVAGVETGRSLSVGRNETCTLSFPGDRFLSGLHFEIVFEDSQLLLRDLSSSNGTYVRGVQIREYALLDRDTISAGESVFLIEFSPNKLPDVADLLSSQVEPVYAVLDAARDPAIYPLLLGSGASYSSLYFGKSAIELEAVAPYLVHLPPRSPAITELVQKGWAKSWGVFLTCSSPMDEIRKQLRRSLKVDVEGNHEQVYFRFYDPRVLRLFLPAAEPAQYNEFAGPITSFLMEAEDPGTILRFHRNGPSIKLDEISVNALIANEPL